MSRVCPGGRKSEEKCPTTVGDTAGTAVKNDHQRRAERERLLIYGPRRMLKVDVAELGASCA